MEVSNHIRGDAVYDGRYYSCLKIDTAYLLSNENKEACVITENGKKGSGLW